MAMTGEQALLNNQSILQDFALVEELDEQAAETISGGYEVFTIRNKTRYTITHNLDGRLYTIRPGEGRIYTTSRGFIRFDTDGRNQYRKFQSYNLSDGRVYEFQDNRFTRGNPFDIDLYRVC